MSLKKFSVRLNGRRYSSSARVVGVFGEYNPCDINSYSETLYFKRNGEYFIFAVGGPNSIHAVSDDNGNSFCYGESVILLNDDLLKLYLSGDRAEFWESFYLVCWHEAEAGSGYRWQVRVC